jgi:hypothetical protein
VTIPAEHAVPADGTALHLRLRTLNQSAQSLAGQVTAAIGVDTIVEPAAPLSDLSRLRDTPAWIAGEAITRQDTPQSWGWLCTSGLPSRRNSDDRSFLITAAHCAANGTYIYTGWENGGRNYIGRVAMRDDLHDAAAIDTSSTGPTAGLEWDGPRTNSFLLVVDSYRYSYNGDYVCHDGCTSGVVCGIKVIDGDYTWVGGNGVTHRGVEGQKTNGGVAGQGGDSGGLVFAIPCSGCSDRQARGIVSGGDYGSIILWTEAPDIYYNLGLHLAP